MHSTLTEKCLDYYSSLFFGLTHKSLHKIQLVQNSAARIITRTTLHATSLLFRLHWLPLKFHINFKILLLVFKAITPPYLSDLLHVVTSSCTLRSSSFLHLTVPSACLTIKGFGAFSCPAPRLIFQYQIYWLTTTFGISTLKSICLKWLFTYDHISTYSFYLFFCTKPSI